MARIDRGAVGTTGRARSDRRPRTRGDRLRRGDESGTEGERRERRSEASVVPVRIGVTYRGSWAGGS
jgi:hypothetical protein